LSGSKTEQQADRASYGSVTVAHHPVPKLAVVWRTVGEVQ